MDKLTSELWKASKSCDYHLAIQLINRGAKVNEPRRTRDDPVMTLLHTAAAIEDIELMRLLIDHGGNLHARDSKNRTPLHWAVTAGDSPDIVEMLINEGADMDAQNDFKSTPLHMAVRNKYIESAQKLIARGASIEAVDMNNWTALHMAVFHENLRMVKMLISHRININAKDIQGYTPLHMNLTLEGGNAEITELFLDNGADVNTKSTTDFPLVMATSNGCLTTLHLLLKRGARVNETTHMGDTALHVACLTKRADMAALLLKFGANINARNHKGKIPFELLPKCPSSEATAQIIIREAVTRETLGQPLFEGHKQMVQSCENYLQFDQECRDEVKRMRSEKIDAEHSVVSFFHIFSMDEEKLTGIARNKNIVTAFESSNYLSAFRIYASDLIAKFEVAKVRAKTLMSIENCLVDKYCDILPASIVQKIAVYIYMSNPVI